MANWNATLNLLPEWNDAKDGKITAKEMAGVVATRIRAIKWPENFQDEMEDIADEFQTLAEDDDTDVQAFDYMMRELYDAADQRIDDSPWPHKKLCWVKTF